MKGVRRIYCLAVTALETSAVFVSDVIVQDSTYDLYENVVPADTADCLKKVIALPLATYEMKYDSVNGRRHLGPVGPGLEDAIPESFEIHAKRTYPSPHKGEDPIVVEGQAVVDRAVVFMHNVGATQELANRSDAMWKQLQDDMEVDARMSMAVDELEARLSEEADAQLVERNRIIAAEAETARLEEELERKKAEEARKSMEEEGRLQQEALDLQLKIAKRKLAVEAESSRAEHARNLVMQEDSAHRRESSRLETETELRKRRMELERRMDADKLQMDMERVRAEIQAKAAAEQENQDLSLHKIRAQGEEDRRRTQEAINTVFAHITGAAMGLISNPRRSAMLASWLLALVTGYLILREGILLLRQLAETYLGKPGLIRETSRVSALGSAVRLASRLMKGIKSTVAVKVMRRSLPQEFRQTQGLSARIEAEHAFHDVVLLPDLKERVLCLAVSMVNAKRNRAPYRHLLLYGPPGTGKTMVAKRLAACSGMECAVMSGGDVGPLGKDAVTELHRLFQWAAKSPRGLLLFIDEAEAFLGKRSSPNMSEDTRNALNALLYNTGSASHRLMMVLATNRAEDLDEAVLDRMDDALLFPVPDKKSRAELLTQYFHKYCTTGLRVTKRSFTPATIVHSLLSSRQDRQDAWLSLGAGVDDRLVKGLADQVEGFSGREVAKLMLSVQSCAYGSEDGVLTADMLKRVVSQKAREHSVKAKMRLRHHL